MCVCGGQVIGGVSEDMEVTAGQVGVETSCSERAEGQNACDIRVRDGQDEGFRFRQR